MDETQIEKARRITLESLQAEIDKLKVSRDLLFTNECSDNDSVYSHTVQNAKLQAEIDEALKIIHRFAYFDIYKDRSDALNMIAKRFLNKHDYKGE